MKAINLLTAVLLLTVINTQASELIYTPVNPSFGGNPLNGTFLINSANAQNDKKDPSLEDDKGLEETSELDDFNSSLQRALLSKLTSTLSGQMVDADGNLVPGVLETGDFIIEITDLGGGQLQVTTTDKSNGESTTFKVDSI